YSKRFDVKLYSEKLKISGVIDMIIENKNDAIPVDFKTNEPINYTAYILQLYSYSLLLEDVLGKSSSYGFILFTSTKKLTRIEYDYEIKDLFQKIYLEIVDIIKSERFPEPSFLHCDGCEYLNFCGDIK
ncbi:MAG: CRISPR-associated protein Cas4, partial [Endomicrobia bacterium]|nr:CRISPR-associated protein Cas4 [Endomicrobiia bacterium]